MILLDSNDIKRRVSIISKGHTEGVAVEAAYHLLGGSENWLVRQSGNFTWLENRQNGRRLEFRPCPPEGAEIELPDEPSEGAKWLISRALVA